MYSQGKYVYLKYITVIVWITAVLYTFAVYRWVLSPKWFMNSSLTALLKSLTAGYLQ